MTMRDNAMSEKSMIDEFGDSNDRFIRSLKSIVHLAARLLAVMMVVVVLLGVVDVAWTLYQKVMAPPRFILTINDILATFGAFMAVLIAIEILINILVYLRRDVMHVKLVMATALMAIARKVIILDFDTLSAQYVWATAGVVLAMSAGYWLVVVRGIPVEKQGGQKIT